MVGNRRHIAACVLLAGGAALAAAALGTSLPGSVTEGIQQALQSLERRDYARAEAQGLTLATDPRHGTPRAWAIVAAARQRRGAYSSAARAYRLLMSSCDSQSLQQYAARQIQVCQQGPQVPKVPVAPSRRLDEDTLRKLGEAHDRTYAESSEHFIVKARNPHLARILVAEAEVALDRICRVILAGQEYPHSVTIDVWLDHADYHAHAEDAPEWAGGSFRFAVDNGVTTRQIDLTQRDEKGRFAAIMLDRVLPHEMCHLVLQEYFGDAACPLFLNEGLAMMAESEVDTRRVELAGKTIAGKARICLESLFVCRRYDIEEPADFYAESFSFVEFLHGRMTPRQFRTFLEHVKGGCPIADALQRSLYVPASESFLPALASAWEDHAIEQAQYLEALSTCEEADQAPSEGQ
jgi:hypothetical protein